MPPPHRYTIDGGGIRILNSEFRALKSEFIATDLFLPHTSLRRLLAARDYPAQLVTFPQQDY
jgi:hypothetical protein